MHEHLVHRLLEVNIPNQQTWNSSLSRRIEARTS